MERPTEQEKVEVQKILDRQTQMESERHQTEQTWQECMENIVPRKSDVTSTLTPGNKRGHDLFDGTAIMANELLAGALHSMLTNQSTKFFDLVMGDPSLDDDEEVKAWLQMVSDRMHSVINNSNFQTEIHELYIDLGAIGTACMFIGEHDDRVIHFGARSMKEVFAKENNLGLIDIVHRKFQWNLRQIVLEFGKEALPEKLRRMYESGNEDKFTILHAVEPKDDSGTPHKITSRYVIPEMKLKLQEKGFFEFPYVVPRWTKTTGETYGRGPGMTALPDVKMLQRMMETTLKGAQKTVDPPLMVADDGVIGKVRLTPSGLTVVRMNNGEMPIRPLINDARIDFGYQAVEDTRKRIKDAFYVNQLQLRDGPQMTATEVNQRTEETLRLMGPVLGRQNFEFLRPMVERVFGVMSRKGMIPTPPQQIAGKRFDVRFSSMIARVQRTSDGQNISRALGVAAPIINAIPGTLDNLNGDRAFRHVMDIYGVPAKILSTTKEVKDQRASRQQAQAQATQEAQQQHQADMVQKVGPTVTQAQQQKGQVQ